MPDGGTMIEAKGVTDQNRRSRFIAGLIGAEYDMNDQIAILANGTKTEQYAEEYMNFEENRDKVKAYVDELLARPQN